MILLPFNRSLIEDGDPDYRKTVYSFLKFAQINPDYSLGIAITENIKRYIAYLSQQGYIKAIIDVDIEITLTESGKKFIDDYEKEFGNK